MRRAATRAGRTGASRAAMARWRCHVLRSSLMLRALAHHATSRQRLGWRALLWHSTAAARSLSDVHSAVRCHARHTLARAATVWAVRARALKADRSALCASYASWRHRALRHGWRRIGDAPPPPPLPAVPKRGCHGHGHPTSVRQAVRRWRGVAAEWRHRREAPAIRLTLLLLAEEGAVAFDPAVAPQGWHGRRLLRALGALVRRAAAAEKVGRLAARRALPRSVRLAYGDRSSPSTRSFASGAVGMSRWRRAWRSACGGACGERRQETRLIILSNAHFEGRFHVAGRRRHELTARRIHAIARWASATGSRGVGRRTRALRLVTACRVWSRFALARTAARSRRSTAAWCLAFCAVKRRFRLWHGLAMVRRALACVAPEGGQIGALGVRRWHSEHAAHASLLAATRTSYAMARLEAVRALAHWAAYAPVRRAGETQLPRFARHPGAWRGRLFVGWRRGRVSRGGCTSHLAPSPPPTPAAPRHGRQR